MSQNGGAFVTGTLRKSLFPAWLPLLTFNFKLLHFMCRGTVVQCVWDIFHQAKSVCWNPVLTQHHSEVSNVQTHERLHSPLSIPVELIWVIRSEHILPVKNKSTLWMKAFTVWSTWHRFMPLCVSPLQIFSAPHRSEASREVETIKKSLEDFFI